MLNYDTKMKCNIKKDSLPLYSYKICYRKQVQQKNTKYMNYNSNNYKRYNFDNIDIKKHKRIFIVKIKMKQFNAIKMQYDVNLESIIKRKIKTILRSFFI